MNRAKCRDVNIAGDTGIWGTRVYKPERLTGRDHGGPRSLGGVRSCLIYAFQVMQILFQDLHSGGNGPFKAMQGNTISVAGQRL